MKDDFIVVHLKQKVRLQSSRVKMRQSGEDSDEELVPRQTKISGRTLFRSRDENADPRQRNRADGRSRHTALARIGPHESGAYYEIRMGSNLLLKWWEGTGDENPNFNLNAFRHESQDAETTDQVVEKEEYAFTKSGMLLKQVIK
jgi:hypothetical protein